MRCAHRLAVLGFVLIGTACDAGPALAPESISFAAAAGQLRLTGSGHHTRIVAGDTALTTFSFSAVRLPDGRVTGRYQYDFRASGFSIHGPVTCVTSDGGQVWVGGVVDQVLTDDEALKAQLLGVDMWWRSKDMGEGPAVVDSTTGLGFKFPTTTITAASWCEDQPVLLVMRGVEHGNIQVAAD